MKIKITKGWGWYAYRVDKEFEVKLVDSRYVVEKSSFPKEFDKEAQGLYVRQSDCEIVTPA